MSESNPPTIEFIDRYSATGTMYPDPKTMCDGPCEGMGCYPQFLAGPWLLAPSASAVTVLDDPPTEEEIKRWHAVHLASAHKISQDKPPICDGWHFIVCPTCEGTRLKK